MLTYIFWFVSFAPVIFPLILLHWLAVCFSFPSIPSFLPPSPYSLASSQPQAVFLPSSPPRHKRHPGSNRSIVFSSDLVYTGIKTGLLSRENKFSQNSFFCLSDRKHEGEEGEEREWVMNGGRQIRDLYCEPAGPVSDMISLCWRLASSVHYSLFTVLPI